jgi:hypothetical protein
MIDNNEFSAVNSNLKIIETLRSYLETVITDSTLKESFTQNKKDFIRNRKLTFKRTIGLILNMLKRSLSIEIIEYFSYLSQESETCTKGAFSLQRTKLKPLFFHSWNKLLVNSFYTYYGNNVKRWKGFIIQAVDGSKVYLMNTEEVINHFGVQGNQHRSIAMGMVMQIQDILNDITIQGGIYPVKTSEVSIMYSWVKSLQKKSITMFDRCYPGYPLMYMLANQPESCNFVMRCKVGFNNAVKQFIKSSKYSKIIEIKPCDSAIATLKKLGYQVTANTSIKVRAVKVILPSGVTEILLTNLMDTELYTIDDLKYLYGLRWGIETTYDKQKNQLQLEQFSGLRVICIEQDYAASLIVANLQSLIEKQSVAFLENKSSKRKYPCKINKNLSWAALKHNIVKIFLCGDPLKLLIELQKAFEKHVEPIRPQRQYPRMAKVKRLHGKYQTFNNYKRAI